jgi:hypothetical protein
MAAVAKPVIADLDDDDDDGDTKRPADDEGDEGDGDEGEDEADAAYGRSSGAEDRIPLICPPPADWKIGSAPVIVSSVAKRMHPTHRSILSARSDCSRDCVCVTE